MARAKDDTFRTLARQFNRIYDDFVGEIGTANRIAPSEKTDLAVLAEKLEWSDKLYALCERAEHMPVWPFNFTIISRFAGLFGSVILAIGLGLAITQLADFGG